MTKVKRERLGQTVYVEAIVVGWAEGKALLDFRKDGKSKKEWFLHSEIKTEEEMTDV